MTVHQSSADSRCSPALRAGAASSITVTTANGGAATGATSGSVTVS